MRVNKRDLDLTVALYELLPDGNYFHLFAPAEEFRASYLRDPARRRLLARGAAEWLDFTSRADHGRARRVGRAPGDGVASQQASRPGDQLRVGQGRERRLDRLGRARP